ncbi:hypothetical protein DSUL_50266 [Desulfovibrionales bacterium]
MPVEAPLISGKVRDVNGATLVCLIYRAVGRHPPCYLDIVPDQTKVLQAALQACLADTDVVFISGGSSIEMTDFTRCTLKSTRC